MSLGSPRGAGSRPGAALAVLVALTGAAFSCQGPAEPDGADDEIIVAFGLDTAGYPEDDWDLAGGGVTGDSLELRVAYTGGCEEHRFRLLAVDDWVPLPGFGPSPTVGVELRLSHDARGDACEAALTRTLRFGLDPLRRAYRARYGDGPARLLLQITDGRDGFAIQIFDWMLGGTG